MQPYNYNVQQIDPFGSALKGMQTGMAFNQMKAQQVAQKQQMANQARIQGELADLSSDFSYDSLLKFSLRNPEYVKQFEKLYEPMSLREKEESFKDASRMYALSLSNPEAAIIELDNRSKVFAESGDEEQARLFKGLADGARQNPGSLSTSIGMFLYGADSDKFAEMQDKLSGAKLKSAQAKKAEKEADFFEDKFIIDAETKAAQIEKDQAQTELYKEQTDAVDENIGIAETKNVINKMNAMNNKARLEFDKNEAKKLPPEVVKEINKTYDGIKSNLTSIAKMNNIFKNNGLSFKGGIMERAEEKLKALLGKQDKFSLLKTNIQNLVNKEAINSLPPGTASEKDMEIVFSGFPPKGSKYEQYRDYFSAVKRVMVAKNKYLDVELQWKSKNRSTGNATSAFKINGYDVIPDETLFQFINRTKMTQSDFLKKNNKSVNDVNTEAVNTYKKSKKPDWAEHVNR